jgi:hypothetical protein
LILQIDRTDVSKYAGKKWLPMLQLRKSNIFWIGAGIDTLGYYNVNNRPVRREERRPILLQHRLMLPRTAATWQQHCGRRIAAAVSLPAD